MSTSKFNAAIISDILDHETREEAVKALTRAVSNRDEIITHLREQIRSIRTAKNGKTVGQFISNNVSSYDISPPCECGKDTVTVDDYWAGPVKCNECKKLLFDAFEPDFKNID